MKLTDDELLDEIKRLHESLGRPPKYRELKHGDTTLKRFGSLKNAFEACGIHGFATPKSPSFERKDRIVNGYRVIYRPDHFNCNLGSSFRGYVYEHRYVMERKLGRPLAPDEVVHHLDSDRLNNDISNLIVLSNADHTKLHMWLKATANKQAHVPQMDRGADS